MTQFAGGAGKIAFWGYRDQADQSVVICTMNANGSNEHCWNAPAGVPATTSAAWLPNGRQLVFQISDTLMGDGSVVIMNDDGSGQQVLNHVKHLNWSPDGSHTLYEKYDGLSQDSYELLLGDAQGQNPVTIGLNAEGDTARWSPDGTRIAYEEVIDSVQNIDVVSIDGTQRVNLTHNDTSSYPYHFWIMPPEWLPDGKHIIYANETEFYIANADGSGQVTLFHYLGGFEISGPYVSPDGKYAAFWLPTAPMSIQGEVMLINTDGSNQHVLISNTDLGSIVWNPTSGEILTTRRGELFRVHVSDGRAYELPTRGVTTANAFAWSLDGKWIFYPLTDPTGKSAIYRMDTEGKQTCRLTDAPYDIRNALWSVVPLSHQSIRATLTAVAPGLASVAPRYQIEASKTVAQIDLVTRQAYATAIQRTSYDLATQTAVAAGKTATQQAAWTIAPDRSTDYTLATMILMGATQTVLALPPGQTIPPTSTLSATATLSLPQKATQTADQATLFAQATPILREATQVEAAALTMTSTFWTPTSFQEQITLTVLAAATNTQEAKFERVLTATAHAPAPAMCYQGS